MGSELELKLEIAADAADELERAGLLGPSVAPVLLHATYYDTADHRLRSHGLSLRIRREGKRLVQAVKASKGAAAGLFDRGEWEFTVPKWRPVVDERTPLARALGPAQAALASQFDLVVHRDSFAITAKDAAIAVALDRGTARAMDRTAAFCEVELELTAGDPAELFALARRIDAAAPVRIGVLTKPERGFRLMGALRHAERAEAVKLHATQSPVAACAQVVAGCLHHYRLNENILLQRREPEAVHQARVALRRLRSALTIFAELLPDDATARLDAALRDLAREYGKARDLDVLLGRGDQSTELADLIARRDAAHHDLKVTLGAAATRRLTLDLAEWLAIGGWRNAGETAALRAMPLGAFAARALARRLKQVRKHGRHLVELDDAGRHALRKDAKKLRYAVDFLGAIYARGPAAKLRRKFLLALEDLQHNLGELNDLAFEADALGHAAPDRSAERDKLLHKASAARHDLLDCAPFWE